MRFHGKDFKHIYNWMRVFCFKLISYILRVCNSSFNLFNMFYRREELYLQNEMSTRETFCLKKNQSSAVNLPGTSFTNIRPVTIV